MKVLLPPNEAPRPRAIEHQRAAGNSVEEGWNEWPRLAACICDVPFAFISFIENGVLTVKAKVGLIETPSDESFCAETIRQSDLFVVEDLLEDQRFANSPSVISEPHARFYAGVPLLTPAGEALGTLCVMDRQPRQLSIKQSDALWSLSRQVVIQHELRQRSANNAGALQGPAAERGRPTGTASESVLHFDAGTREERQPADAALQQSEERYRELCENASDIIYTQDLEGNFLSLNKTGEKITGYTREEAVQLNFEQVVAPEYLELARRMIARKTIEDTATVYKLEILAKDGRRVPVEVSTRLFYQHGQAIGVQGIARDVTERAQAEKMLARREQYLSALVEVGRILLSTADAEDFYAEVLALLGEVSGASRVYVFENHHDEAGQLLTSHRAEWCAAGIKSHLHSTTTHNVPLSEFAPRWVEKLSQGEPVVETAAEFPETARPELEAENICSILLLPLIVRGEFFGFIGFDSCTEERVWEASEVALLSAAARAISLAHERREAELNHRESEERYRFLYENNPTMYLTVDSSGTVLSVNQFGAAQLGYTPEELTGKPVFNAFYEEDRRLVSDLIAACLNQPSRVYHLELRKVRKDGSLLWVKEAARTAQGADGRPVILLVCEDITERKQAGEEAARLATEIEAERKRLNAIVASVPGVVWEAWGVPDKASQRIDFVSNYVEEMLGYSVEEWLSTPNFWLTIVHDEDKERAGQQAARIFQSGKGGASEFRWMARDGRVLWVEARSVVIHDDGGNPIGMRGVTTNITERKVAAEAEHRSEEKYKGIFNNATMGIYQSAPDGTFITANPTLAHLLGYESPEELLHCNLGDDIYYQPEEREKLIAIHSPEGSATGIEVLWKKKDGTPIWLHLNARVVRDGQGEILYFDGFAHDITERKRAEEALRYAEQRAIIEYEQLLDKLAHLAEELGTARDLATIFHALRDFATASTRSTGIFVSLYDPERKQRSAIYSSFDGQDIDVSMLPPMPMTDSPQSRAVATGKIIITDDFQAAMGGRPVINVGLQRDPRLPGSSLAAPMSIMGRVIGAVEVQSPDMAAFKHEHATAMRMAANLTAIAIENVRLFEREHEREEQLRQSQKIEAVGRLAGGIAHDFNNLLAAIIGYCDILLMTMSETDPARQKIGEIYKAADRAAALTSQLLAFSRRQARQPRVLDLNAMVTETNRMMRPLIGEQIELVTKLDPALGRIKADPHQMQQVLMNLAVNARDAMYKKRGTLTIETSNEIVDPALAHERVPMPPGRYVALTVSDTGTGMDAVTQAHIFEPFFTTKEIGKGTGLGLAMVYGIVKQSDGFIWVYSEENQGTTFKIYLPLVEDELTRTESGVAPSKLPQGTETILLVEDEDMVRAAARQVLETCGYKVLEATDGYTALEVYKRYEGTIHLLLTDVIMPRMDGQELVEHLVKLSPQMRVLYMSGYADDVIGHHGKLDEGVAFLQKPAKAPELARKVRDVLDA